MQLANVLSFGEGRKMEEPTLTTAPLGRQLTMCRIPSCLAPTSNTRRVGSANDPLTSVYILSSQKPTEVNAVTVTHI